MAHPAHFDQFAAQETRRLVAVRMRSDPDLPRWPALVELTFDEFTVYVCAEPQIDTLLCTRTLPGSYSCNYPVELPTTFWNGLIGWTLTDAWQMKNDRGYLDAIQLWFRQQPNAGRYRYVQLWAICSSVRLFEFQVRRQEPPISAPSS